MTEGHDRKKFQIRIDPSITVGSIISVSMILVSLGVFIINFDDFLDNTTNMANAAEKWIETNEDLPLRVVLLENQMEDQSKHITEMRHLSEEINTLQNEMKVLSISLDRTNDRLERVIEREINASGNKPFGPHLD